MILIYFAIIALSVTQSASVKEFNKGCDNPFKYNIFKTSASALLMVLLFVWSCSFHPESVSFGVVYGISLSASNYFGFKALSTGPLSLTSMTVSFSVIMPIIYGIAFCGESVTLYRLIGFALLVVTLILNKFGKEKSNTAKGEKWWLYVLTTFFTNGICSILQKAHQNRFPGKYTAEFMISATLVSLAIFFALYLINKNKDASYGIPFRSKIFGVVSGIATALVNYFSIYLAGFRDASVLFPLISIGTVLGALICGIIRYKERPKPITIAVIIVGIASVVFLKIT